MSLQKYKQLLELLKSTYGNAIAFSGGVDSVFLLHALQEVHGGHVLAITASTPYIPQWEIKEACAITAEAGVRHEVEELPFPEQIRSNPPDHCYTCKKTLFTRIWEIARANGYNHLMDGTNVDDLNDYRPGLQALQELGVISPLMVVGMTKQNIRDLSRDFDLPTWNKPSFACLLSRMPINKNVTEEALRQVEHSETYLMKNGFPAVRVRHHEDVARIEVPKAQIKDLVDADKLLKINARLKALGYKHVSVDLNGYSMGSLNQIDS